MQRNAKNSERIETARTYRKEAGVSERIIWEFLRGRRIGFKFRRQHPIGPYILDFYCDEALLCVEVDGEQHALRAERDAKRDEYLLELGVLTYRLPSIGIFEETSQNMTEWLRQIGELCETKSGRRAFPGT
ncbi:endonuclease domain-containing protein [Fimbriimonas ginsengisoli]|uniref:DUF559 domain-containing protein n=1 Tax=Fimbriimonas ginsengisoli Gsoil 348 TaxID=661478 RepID=A0A068NRQ8_FIMGI|nr:DUF559 domain-containing protein [Fimbriimonas ginsengisoli]AIE85450.1 hypothetical protein OP10G_2082 [Fimbriimonas ginsengisoli Gsoil 348]